MTSMWLEISYNAAAGRMGSDKARWKLLGRCHFYHILLAIRDSLRSAQIQWEEN